MATTQELLDKLKANITSIYDKLESKGVQVEGNRNLDNLVLAIDNVGSGGGGAEPTPVNLLQAPITLTEDMTSDGYGEFMAILDYSFGFEVGKYYIAKGTYGENNTPFEFPSMVIDMQGMIMFYAMDKEEALVVAIYDKIAMDEDGNPVPSENSSYIMISGNTSLYPTPITVDSISLMNRSSNCLNDIQVPNDSVTTTYFHYQEEDIDVYCPIVSANIPMDETVLDGTIKSLALKVGDRTLVCDGMMTGEIQTSVGGYTDDGLEFTAIFETEMGSGTLSLIKGYRANYYIMNEETGEFDYELIKDDTCMCVVGYFMFMDAVTQEEVKDIVYYRPTVLEALSVSDKIVEEAMDVFISGDRDPQYADFDFFDLTKVRSIGEYAFSGKPFNDIYIPENIEYVNETAFVGISAQDIEFDENCMKNQSSGALLRFDNSSFNKLKLRAQDWASFRNANQNIYSNSPIYMASPPAFEEGMFQFARLFSVNSENQDEWIFNNDVDTYLNISEKAFQISPVVAYPNVATLELNYPNATSLNLNNPSFNFNKVTINIPNCTQSNSFFQLNETNLKEFTINTSNEYAYVGYFEVGGGDGLEKLVTPHFNVRFARRDYNRENLKYMDVMSINMVFDETGNALGAFSNLETLILHGVEHNLTKYLTDTSAIMQGITPVYVPDEHLETYRSIYSNTVIQFKGISELA